MTEGEGVDAIVSPALADALWAALPEVSKRTITAVLDEVPEYTSQQGGDELTRLEQAVHDALAAFLRRATRPTELDTGATAAGLDAAYALGRGEARRGQTMDPLLSAYRVGARASWREWVCVLARQAADAIVVATFAELVFTFIDELSAASVAGHADELAASRRAQGQLLDRLGHAILTGERHERLLIAAEQANWSPPETLTVVLVPSARRRAIVTQLDPRTLAVAADGAGVAFLEDHAVLLVPDVHHGRARLLTAISGHAAIVGPTRPWFEASASALRVARAVRLIDHSTTEPIDVDDHLVELVLGADPEALADLRIRALAPLAGRRPATAERLAETLRSWLLHQGRRDDVAEHLHIHPQTVRYRMAQIREDFGDRLTSPDAVLELVVALAVDTCAKADVLPEPK